MSATLTVPNETQAKEIQRLFDSFPNFNITFDGIKQINETQVKVEKVQVTGTHTGKPFSFGPYEEIPTSNKHVILDQENLLITIASEDDNNGVYGGDLKIIESSIRALGPMTGPPGFYMSIGGMII